MTTSRLISQGVRSMRRYKLRTAFMMLGSLVGVAAISFVMSVGQSAKITMLRTVRQMIGDQSLIVVGRGSRMMGGAHAGAARLTIDDIAAVASAVPEVEAWDPSAELRTSVRVGDASTTARVIGASERFERVWGRGVSAGETFDASGVASSARVALIGETVARELFGSQDPLGSELLIGGVPVKVIGLLERYGIDLHGMDRDNEIVVPISTLMRRLANMDAISTAKLIVRDASTQDATERDVRRVLRERHGLSVDQQNDFSIISSIEVQQMMNTVQRALLVYMPLAGGIVLLVGGVVAATLMLGAVNERTGEIGVRRAVGAQPRDIRDQFLLETTLIIVAGASIGVVLGYFGAQWAGSRMRLDVGFSWLAVVVGLLAAALTGLAAGVAPARRAARLHPAEALR